MTTHPPDLPEDPRELLGDPLWDRLGAAETPPVPVGFDARFRATLRTDAPWYRRRWVSVGAGAAGMVAAAAALVVVLQPPPVLVEPVPPADDLALVADLELVENLDLLQDLDLLMAWDGQAP